MNAKTSAIVELQAELDRVRAGGNIDRDGYTHFLTVAVGQLEGWRDAYYEANSQRNDFARQCTSNEGVLQAMSLLLDVMQRACRHETDATQPIEFARDMAPFKNVMRTVYGLGSCGEELPKRKPRKAKAAGVQP